MTRATDTDLLPLSLGLRLLQRVEFRGKLGLCERLFAAALAGEGIRWVRTAPGPVWKLDLSNPTHRWIVYGSYEGPGFWRWIRRRRGQIATVVDSGANIGQTVLYFATWLPGARILAYEPGHAAREWLEQGIARNGFSSVTVEAKGLGRAAGKAGLAAAADPSLHGSWNRVQANGGELIELAALDDELARHGAPTLDLWKLDVEGYAMEALLGASRALAQGRIRAIHLELDDSDEQTVAFLRSHRYTGWSLTPAGGMKPLAKRRRWGNALFLAPAPA